jgi:hypothetical protein
LTTELGGAPVGSHNRANGKLAQNALKRVLAREFGSLDAGLEVAAEVMVRKLKRGRPKQEGAEVADDALNAAAESANTIFDRIDGKAAQAITGDGGGALKVEVKAVVVTPDMFAGFTRDEIAVVRQAVPLLRRAGILSIAGPSGPDGGGSGEAERGDAEF